MDRYTKSALTVIAASLLWLAIKDVGFIFDALAATGVVEVKVVSMNLSQYQPIPVAIQGEVSCKLP